MMMRKRKMTSILKEFPASMKYATTTVAPSVETTSGMFKIKKSNYSFRQSQLISIMRELQIE
jgi:hypothetical protein